MTGFLQSQLFLFIHLRWPNLGLPQNYAYNKYNTEQDTTSLKDDVQFSREVLFTYISSNFIMFFYLAYSYRHSKLKKGMEEHTYNTEQDTTSLRDDVQLSRVVPFTYISSNFIMFFYLTCSYRHCKLKKGMEVPQERHHIKKQLKLYKNTFCQLFHCKIQTFHCPNFKPLFPGILKIDFVLIIKMF